MQTRAFLRTAAACAALVLAIAAVLLAGSARKAGAAAVGVTKTLCVGSSCGVNSVTPATPVYYKITLSAPSNTPVTVSDTYPVGFTPTGTNPTCTSGTNTITTSSLSTSGQTISFNLTVPPGPGVVCIINGYFSLAALNLMTNTVTATDSSGSISASWNASLNLATPIPGNVTVAKTASTGAVNVMNSAQTVVYTITVANTGGTDLFLGNVLRLEDRLKLNPYSVPLKATYVSSTCTVSAPTPPQYCVDTSAPIIGSNPLIVNSLNPIDFVAWRYPVSGAGSAGLLKAGSVMTVTMTMTIDRIPGLDCIIQSGKDGVFNVAHAALNLPPISGPGPGTALSDAIPSDNTSLDVLLGVTTGSTAVDPACGYGYFPPSPVLRVDKYQVQPSPASVLNWPNAVEYKIVLTNISTNKTLTKIALEDITAEGVGTPPFTAQQTVLICSTICSSSVTLAPQQLLGYGDAKTVFTTQLNQTLANSSLPPGQSEAFNLRVRYELPDCDSYQSIAPKPIYNIARVTGWTENGTTAVTSIVQGDATTLMVPPPSCNLQVKKIVLGFTPRIRFQPAATVYKVTYQNLDAIPHTVGTLIDTMRLTTSNYATQLNAQSTYKCTPTGSVTGYPATNQNWPAPDPATVVYTSLAQQGVRLIDNGNSPVTFAPGAMLTCIVTVRVQRPAQNDPFCATNGVLQNTGIMDTSRFYNPNLPWSSSPGSFYATVLRPLPKCFDPVINKVVSPLWTWPGGGPVTFTLTIHDPPTASAITPGPEIVDTIFPPLATTGSSVFGCTPGGCATQWGSTPPGANFVLGQSLIRINALPPNATTTATYTVVNTPAHPFVVGSQICNKAYARMRPPLGPTALDFYWKNPSTSNPNETASVQACAPVVQTGTIIVKKLVTVDAGFTATATTFPITVQCQNGSYPVGASTVTLGANQAAQIPGIPVGSSCSTSEQLPPPIQTPALACQLRGWFPPTITPNPLGPTTGGTMIITVKNRYGCLATTASLIVKKTVTVQTNYTAPAVAFPITVQCQSGSASTQTSVSLLANASSQINNIPLGSTCTTTEIVPPPTANTVCNSVGWSPPVITPSPVTLATAGTTIVNIVNHYGCLSPAGGTIVIKKSVTSDQGYTAPQSTTFPITVQCQSGSNTLPPYNVTVLGNTSTQIGNVPTGVTCTTTEQLPPPTSTPGVPCQSVGWFPPVITPNPLGPTTNGVMQIAVANRYGCLVNNSTVSMTVKKLVSSTNFMPPASATFPITVSCPPAPPVTVTLGANQTAPINGIPVGNTCTVSEVLPPSLPHPACAVLGWSPPVITPSPIVASANGVITVQNTFGCLQPSTPATGTVVVNKVVLSSPPFPAPPTTFTLTLQCPIYPLATATVVNGVAQFTGVPSGMPCNLAEQPLPPPITNNPACHAIGWFPVQISPNPVTVPAAGSVTVTAVNRYGCLP
jgi:hypothetical protein